MELWLPRSSESASPTAEVEDVASNYVIETPVERSLSILLIDDNQQLREMTAMSLRHFGLDVTAAGGAEGCRS